MAKTAFDFNLDDSTRLENLFGPIGNIVCSNSSVYRTEFLVPLSEDQDTSDPTLRRKGKRL
jgi:hypothetical protein